AHAQRRRKDVHEAARRDAEPRNKARLRARTQRVRHDVENVRPGREVEKPARDDEQQQVLGIGHGRQALKKPRMAAIARSTPAASTSRCVTKRRRYRPIASTPFAARCFSKASERSRAAPTRST